MNNSLFHTHDSDRHIMSKKDRLEVQNWTDMLEAMNTEVEYLARLEAAMLNNLALYQQLQALRRENTLTSAALYRHENAMRNALECDNLECDAFYLHKHEKLRQLFLEHLNKHNQVKVKVLAKLMQNTGK